ncbi:uncharacterized protein BJX67DRAFT_242590 [Aspergillus lucknowensis]|uniref:Uncharacterized protein n=1 Tax=Aspergillus lucknowensis TaxID=176173 RepID=A0ABR4M1H8_9EURO
MWWVVFNLEGSPLLAFKNVQRRVISASLSLQFNSPLAALTSAVRAEESHVRKYTIPYQSTLYDSQPSARKLDHSIVRAAMPVSDSSRTSRTQAQAPNPTRKGVGVIIDIRVRASGSTPVREVPMATRRRRLVARLVQQCEGNPFPQTDESAPLPQI